MTDKNLELVDTIPAEELKPQSDQLPPKKYYKVINTDLYRNKKVIPEGSIVDFYEPAFASFLIPVDNAEESLHVHSDPETVPSKSGRGRPRKIIN